MESNLLDEIFSKLNKAMTRDIADAIAKEAWLVNELKQTNK